MVFNKFFSRNAEEVARDLIGRILIFSYNGKKLKFRVLETEAYFGEDDPASWARFGKRKDNHVMWEKPGKILIKNVHMYKMLNFSTGKKDDPQAVLIRAIEPLNFSGKTSGPGLLTRELSIGKELNGKDFNDFFEFVKMDNKNIEVVEGFRIGVRKDLDRKLNFKLKQI